MIEKDIKPKYKRSARKAAARYSKGTVCKRVLVHGIAKAVLKDILEEHENTIVLDQERYSQNEQIIQYLDINDVIVNTVSVDIKVSVGYVSNHFLIHKHIVELGFMSDIYLFVTVYPDLEKCKLIGFIENNKLIAHLKKYPLKDNYYNIPADHLEPIENITEVIGWLNKTLRKNSHGIPAHEIFHKINILETLDQGIKTQLQPSHQDILQEDIVKQIQFLMLKNIDTKVKHALSMLTEAEYNEFVTFLENHLDQTSLKTEPSLQEDAPSPSLEEIHLQDVPLESTMTIPHQTGFSPSLQNNEETSLKDAQLESEILYPDQSGFLPDGYEDKIIFQPFFDPKLTEIVALADQSDIHTEIADDLYNIQIESMPQDDSEFVESVPESITSFRLDYQEEFEYDQEENEPNNERINQEDSVSYLFKEQKKGGWNDVSENILLENPHDGLTPDIEDLQDLQDFDDYMPQDFQDTFPNESGSMVKEETDMVDQPGQEALSFSLMSDMADEEDEEGEATLSFSFIDDMVDQPGQEALSFSLMGDMTDKEEEEGEKALSFSLMSDMTDEEDEATLSFSFIDDMVDQPGQEASKDLHRSTINNLFETKLAMESKKQPTSTELRKPLLEQNKESFIKNTNSPKDENQPSTSVIQISPVSPMHKKIVWIAAITVCFLGLIALASLAIQYFFVLYNAQKETFKTSTAIEKTLKQSPVEEPSTPSSVQPEAMRPSESKTFNEPREVTESTQVKDDQQKETTQISSVQEKVHIRQQVKSSRLMKNYKVLPIRQHTPQVTALGTTKMKKTLMENVVQKTTPVLSTTIPDKPSVLQPIESQETVSQTIKIDSVTEQIRDIPEKSPHLSTE